MRRSFALNIFFLFPLLWIISSIAYSADYSAEFVDQIPQGLALPYTTGQTATFKLNFKNTGSIYWNNTRNVTDVHSIELRSVDGANSTTQIDSSLYPGPGSQPLWINRQRVVGPDEERVDPGGIATFTFTVTMPSTAGDYTVYFRPCIYGNFVGTVRYFDLKVTEPAIVSPSDLIALADGTSVNLTWSDKSDNEDGFHVQRKLGENGAWSTIRTVGANVTFCTDAGLSTNRTYYYQVRAYSGSTYSDWSDAYYAVTLEIPFWFTTTVESTTSVNLSWTDTASNETGFKVYRKTEPNGTWAEIADFNEGTATYTSYLDTGLTPDTTYHYGVRAYADSATPTPHFSAMATATATTGLENVTPPSDLIALADGLSVDLAWYDNSDNEDGFEIERKTGNNGTYCQYKILASGSTSYTDTEVSANWKYFYRVRSYKGSTVSDWVEYYAQVMASPAGFSATVNSQTEIDLSWTDSALGETGFKVYRKTTPNGQWAEIADLTPQNTTYTSYTDTNLAFDTTYYYGIRAYADSTIITPHFSAISTVTATTEGLSEEPNWVKTYRLVRAGNGHQDHLYTTSVDEKEASETAGYMLDGEDFMVSSTPFVGCNEVVRLRKDGLNYVIRLYTTSQEEIQSAKDHGYVQETSLGYVYADARLGMCEIKRCYHPGITDRFYTNYEEEFTAAVSLGYQIENSLGYSPMGSGHAPVRPEAVSPDPAPCVAIPPALKASAFNDPDEGDQHVATCWQVTTMQGDYDQSHLILSRVDDPHNLTTIIPNAGALTLQTRYWWRMRYKDAAGHYSSWSHETSFITRCYDPAPKPLTVDGLALSQHNCQGHYQKFVFDAVAGNRYVVTLTPTAGDADLYGSNSMADLDQLPQPPVNTAKSCLPGQCVERLTITTSQSGAYYVAGYGATECDYQISVSSKALAIISATRRAVISGGTVHFDATGSTPSGSGGSIISYRWDFSDGSSATGPEVDHVFHYTDESQYVTLTITDSNGKTAQASISISITGTTQGTTANQSAHSSDPVNMATGNFTYNHTDLVVPGRGIPFVFARAYNSKDPYFTTGQPMGHGWTHSFNLKIIGDPNAELTVLFPDGHGEIFLADENGAYTPETGVHHNLVASPDGSAYTLTLKNQLQYVFDPDLRLASINDPNGNAVTCVYDGTGKLSQIIDTVGRTFSLFYDPAGHLTQLTDPIGRTALYSYNAAGDLTSFTDPAGAITGYAYDEHHQLTTVTDPNGVVSVHMIYDDISRVVKSQSDVYGNAFTFSYDFETGVTIQTDPLGNETLYAHDDEMRLVSIKHPNGYSEYFEYDDQGNRISVTNRRGYTTQYTYDERGNVVTKTDALGQITAITYDERNNPLTLIDPLGGATVYIYDDRGNLLKIADALGNLTTMEYDTCGQLVSKTDPNGHTTLYSSDLCGNLVDVEDALGNHTLFTYDGAGRRLTATNAAGHSATYSYDANDRPLSITDPRGNTISYKYDMAGNRTRVTDARSYATDYVYDLKNRLACVTDPLGGTSTYVYNALDQQIRITQPRLNATSMEYNSDGKPAASIDSLNNKTTFAYDENGNLAQKTDRLNNATQYSYDELDRLVAVHDPARNITRKEYDSLGRVIREIDPMGRSTCFAYDAPGRLTCVTDAGGNETHCTYDAIGNILSITDPRGQTTTMEYDELNRLVQSANSLGQSEVFAYDVVGNLIAKTDAAGDVTHYEYDANNRLTGILYPDGKEVSFTYDENGNRTSMVDAGATGGWTYDALNRITSYIYNGLRISYAYDANGNRTAITYPDAKEVAYGYDMLDRLESVTNWLGRTTTYTYDAGGQLLETVNPNGTLSRFQYDTSERLSEMQNFLPDDTLLTSQKFTMDRVGNIIQEHGLSALDPTDAVRNVEYIYNQTNRLVSAGEVAFNYDDNGNLAEKTNGSLTTKYTYNAANRLVSLDSGENNIEYRYDCLGNRVARIENGQEIHYVIDPNGSLSQALAEMDADSNITKYHIYGLGLIETILSSGETWDYHYDTRGSTVAITDAQGNVVQKYAYDDFGAINNQWGDLPNTFCFLGRFGVMADEDLYYIRARYYDPALGRFITQDPVTGNEHDPQTLNRYIYALNNPVRFVDVSGFSAQDTRRFYESISMSSDTEHNYLVETTGLDTTASYKTLDPQKMEDTRTGAGREALKNVGKAIVYFGAGVTTEFFGGVTAGAATICLNPQMALSSGSLAITGMDFINEASIELSLSLENSVRYVFAREAKRKKDKNEGIFGFMAPIFDINTAASIGNLIP